MSLVNVTSPASAVRPPNFMDKVRGVATVVTEKTKKRFSDAAEHFFFVLEREKNRPVAVKASAAAAPRTVLHSGFLMAEATKQAIPLYEGTNAFQLKPDGTLLPCQPQSHSEFQIEIRVHAEQTTLEDFVARKRSSLFTNDRLELGGRQYIVKMLPQNLRLERVMA